ncbi:MAG TPA: hypothetical protein VIE66_06095 [Methylocella sp.]|jgi:hypothetical protein
MTTIDAGAIEREAIELHGVIESWFAGTRPRTAESYKEFADLLAPDFTSVSPDGLSSSRDMVVSGLEAAYGAYPGITVEIRRFAFIASSTELGVARYEEWQFHPARTSARLSLVVMRRDADTRHGWRWLALHETWLPGGVPVLA